MINTLQMMNMTMLRKFGRPLRLRQWVIKTMTYKTIIKTIKTIIKTIKTIKVIKTMTYTLEATCYC